LRQPPLEGGSATIARADTTLSFPANYMLAAAMNPRPCRQQLNETEPRGPGVVRE
jgi:predicted ATPase with chaperone activity